MVRPECPPDLFVVTLLDHFGSVGAWPEAIRLKWVLHRELSIQMDEDEMVLRATERKNETL